MAYQLFDKNGEQVILHDLQDKSPWCVTGASYEQVFISKYGGHLDLTINPEKSTNIYAPDLFNLATNTIGELKTQNTPFFQAATRYNLNPQYAVTFNVKDYLRYLQYYPEIEIYFGVDWIITGFKGTDTIKVEPMAGIWKVPFSGIREMIKTSPVHAYQQRVFDTGGNAKGSYVFDLQAPSFERVL